jgi:hypothetical protein
MSRLSMSITQWTAALLLLGTAAYSSAEESRRPPKPPAEAFAACASLQEGDACTVQFHSQEIAGTCRTGPESELFCLPKNAPARPNGPPPSGEGSEGREPPAP